MAPSASSRPSSSSSTPSSKRQKKSGRGAEKSREKAQTTPRKQPVLQHRRPASGSPLSLTTFHDDSEKPSYPSLRRLRSSRNHEPTAMFLSLFSTSTSRRDTLREEKIGLQRLPFDLILHIVGYLDVNDICALQLTCKTLREYTCVRAIWRKLANGLLRRCRALPLKGFQRLSDLSTEELMQAVIKASHYESAWRIRAPRPIKSDSASPSGINARSNYMDITPGSTLAQRSKEQPNKWYKVVSAPPGETVDWLSPITSSYTLCATKSGKVVCWDVQSDSCLAEWHPGPNWELWKCRVEFEERTVYFTMAKVVTPTYDDNRVMQFVLMKLTFFDGPSGESSMKPPVFSPVGEFLSRGMVMNVFLLDPLQRLLSAFVWMSTFSTIALYVLLDWNKQEYVFVDTGIECAVSSNWSCILYQNNIVIHCEETDAAYQYFYPISLLQTLTSTLPTPTSVPVISQRLPPARRLTKKFHFPQPHGPSSIPVSSSYYYFGSADDDDSDDDGVDDPYSVDPNSIPIFYEIGELSGSSSSDSPSQPSSTVSQGTTSSSTVSYSSATSSESSASSALTQPDVHQQPHPNPYPFPAWSPESAHFVRQWWPSMPHIPRVSCTVVLLATHDQVLDRNRFVLAQHYFRVPLDQHEWDHGMLHHDAGAGDIDGHSLDSSFSLGDEELCDVPTTPQGGCYSSETPHPPSSSYTPSSSQQTSTGSISTTSTEDVNEDALMRLWYVSAPFEVVRIQDDADEEEPVTRPRPLVAVDFGHAVWIEYVETEESRKAVGERDVVNDPKCLRFVTFPPFSEEYDDVVGEGRQGQVPVPTGQVRTIPHPEELDLGKVETINIDQSQGAVILSDKDGRIFILCYE